jgi:hypothetical protein
MHPADPAEATTRGKDAPRPKQKRPVDPADAAAAPGKFTPSPRRTTGIPNPVLELPIPRGLPPARAAFTVPEFCEAHRISEAKYYEMKKEGWGPVEMEVGRRRLISFEAAAEWRRKREANNGNTAEKQNRPLNPEPFR